MIKIKLKEGVRLTGLSSQAHFALVCAVHVFEELGASEFVVTSANDRTHKRGSKHYRGDGLDFRIWVLPEERRAAARERLAHRLGPDFDVILEADHMHVEYDPK